MRKSILPNSKVSVHTTAGVVVLVGRRQVVAGVQEVGDDVDLHDRDGIRGQLVAYAHAWLQWAHIPGRKDERRRC